MVQLCAASPLRSAPEAGLCTQEAFGASKHRRRHGQHPGRRISGRRWLFLSGVSRGAANHDHDTEREQHQPPAPRTRSGSAAMGERTGRGHTTGAAATTPHHVRAPAPAATRRVGPRRVGARLRSRAQPLVSGADNPTTWHGGDVRGAPRMTVLGTVDGPCCCPVKSLRGEPLGPTATVALAPTRHLRAAVAHPRADGRR